MKQKHTIMVANSEIHIITEEPKEAIDTIVGVVDRRIREIHLHSKSCSRVDAALILCLEYCAEKIKIQKKLKQANAEIERLAVLNEAAARENAALEREIETLRKSLNMTPAQKQHKSASSVQLGFYDNTAPLEEHEPLVIITEEAQEQIVPEQIAPVEETQQTPVEEATPETVETKDKKQSKSAKKNILRSMFDLISFDDI